MTVAEGIQGTSPCVQAENGGLGKSFEVSGWSNFVPGSLIHLWSHPARGWELGQRPPEMLTHCVPLNFP